MSVTAERVVLGTVAAYPGASGRVLGAGTGAREGLDGYLAAGGYGAAGDPAALLGAAESVALRGRGGAGFPLARKLAAVASAAAATGGAPVVVANGEEGEPASVKDRWLLRHRPHLVLDGLRLAASVAGAGETHVYVSDAESAQSVTAAVAELRGRDVWDAAPRVTVVAPAYVAGEETAVVRALDGGPALPTDKPPRPFESGVGGRPTLVSNVETLAGLALLHRLGADGYRAGETFLLTLTGGAAVGEGLYEVPLGVTLREVLAWRGADPAGVTGVLMGGYFGGLLGPRALDVPLEYDAVRLAGSGLGCGAVAVLTRATCPVRLATELMTYFSYENAGQCGGCFNGTAAMRLVLERLCEGGTTSRDVERLAYLSGFLPGRGACGTLDGASAVGASLLREFAPAVTAHLTGRCAVCPATPVAVPGPPFAAAPPAADPEGAAR